LNPVIFDVAPGSFTAFAIRLKTRETQKVIADIEHAWRQFFPQKAFEYSFLSDDLRENYQQESQLMQLSADLAGVALFLACFGLFGLVDFTVRQRRREMSIRKVLGASIVGITRLLTKDFLILVGVAILIATPFAWYFMQKWLNEFAYHIDIQWWMFALAGLAAAAVALFTVGYQSLRAALANPVKALRA
jgi:putative ABC transport system permease protein